MLREDMKGTALIINEYGEVGIDHLMVTSAVETTLLMENGCLCCSLRGDLVDTILNLFKAVERGEIPVFSQILIETTGLADPIPIVRDLENAPALKEKVYLLGLCTVVDGVLGRAGLHDNPVALSQVAQADVCIITKTDLIDDLKLDNLNETLRSINPIMRLHGVRDGELPTDNPLFSSGFARRDASNLAESRASSGHHGHAHGDHHDGIESLSIELDYPLPWANFRDWFDLIFSLHASKILRMKGFLWICERSGPILVQAVGPVVSPTEVLDNWPRKVERTQLVLITKGLSAKALENSFAAHVASQAKDAAAETALELER
jgi:G3E family GTPase